MKKLLSFLGFLLIAALFFIGLTLFSEQQGSGREPPVSVPSMGTVASDNLQALTEAFGCPVPYGSLTGTGRVEDRELGSLRARTLTWAANDGLITTAVRPVEAAQLLRRDQLTLDNSTLWSVGGRTLVMGVGANAACAYYSNDDAAFCLYMADADAQTLLNLLNQTVFFPD